MKQFLFASVFALVSSTIFSQTTVEVKGGLNASTITGKDVSGYKTKTGFYLGGLVQIPIATSLSVQPELYYSSEGAKWDYEGGKTILNYIKIPALVKYKTASGFSGATGPQLGFLISAKDEEDKESHDIKDQLKSTDFSWAFDLGYSFQRLSINARYNLGFTKFYEEEKNSSVQVGLQYRLFATSKSK